MTPETGRWVPVSAPSFVSASSVSDNCVVVVVNALVHGIDE